MAMRDNQSVTTDETSTLISSDKVEGTAVYNREGEKLGSIHTLMEPVAQSPAQVALTAR